MPILGMNQIQLEIERNRALLDQLHDARRTVRGYLKIPANKNKFKSNNSHKKPRLSGNRKFNLIAQGDSWFDYPLGIDIVDCLQNDPYQHTIDRLAVAGSTINDIAFGPVPLNFFGIPQSTEIWRIVELVDRIQRDKPDALLLSGGGNDVAGDEFFSFINNAKSDLPNVNQGVLENVVATTFRDAYNYVVSIALQANPKLKIFTHSYDYPWPDGRGVASFLGWKIGPWFGPSFDQKNFTLDGDGLNTRHGILKNFIDAHDSMLTSLAEDYKDNLIHVSLIGTLHTVDDWANELHPKNPGFAALAKIFDAALQNNIP